MTWWYKSHVRKPPTSFKRVAVKAASLWGKNRFQWSKNVKGMSRERITSDYQLDFLVTFLIVCKEKGQHSLCI